MRGPTFYERTKHLKVDSHYKQETVDKGVIILPQLTSDLKISDSFTKSMESKHHKFLVGKLMLLDPPTFIYEGC